MSRSVVVCSVVLTVSLGLSFTLLSVVDARAAAGTVNAGTKNGIDLALKLSSFAFEFNRDVVLVAWLQDARRAGSRLAAYRNSAPPAIPGEDWHALDTLIARYRAVYPQVTVSPAAGAARAQADVGTGYGGHSDLDDEISEMTSAAVTLGDQTKAALARWRAWFVENGAMRTPAWQEPDVSGAPPVDTPVLVGADGHSPHPVFGGDYRTPDSTHAVFSGTRLLQYDYQMQVYDGVTWGARDALSFNDETVFSHETEQNLPLALILSYSNHGFVFSPPWLWPTLRTDPTAFAAPSVIPAEGTAWKRFDFLNVQHPMVREALLTYLDAIAKHYRDDRRIVYYQGPWEATNGLRNVEGSRDAQSLAAFRAALKSRYKDVNRLNDTWHSRYPSFEEIPLPEERATPASGPQAALSYEFESWRRDQFMGWWAEGYQRLKSADPTHPVGADSNVPIFNADVASAVDYWRLPDAGDVISIHTGDSDEIAERYLYSIRRYRPEKTMGNLEFIWNAPECWKNPPEPVAFAAAERNLWRSAGMGFRLWNIYGQNDTYVPRSSAKQSAYNNLADFPTHYSILRPCAGVIPLLRAKIRTLSDVFDSSEVAQPSIGVLQPSSATTSRAWAPHIAATAISVDSVLSPGNRPYAVVFEEAIATGREPLNELRVLILPYAVAIPTDVATRIFSWMKHGGQVWAIGPAGESTVYGSSDGWLGRAVQSASRKQAPFDPGACSIVGRGAYCTIDDPARLQLDSVRRRFLADVDRVAPRSIFADSDDLGLISRVRTDGTKYLVAFNRSATHTTSARIDTTARFERVFDLGIPSGGTVPMTGNAIGGVGFELVLEPGAGTVFELVSSPKQPTIQ